MALNIKKLSVKEINVLIKDLNAELERRATTEKQLLIAEIRDKAESLNIPVSDLFKEVAKTPRKRGGSVKPKYRNPGDKTQTWTGRGLKPRWVRDLLDSGKSLEDIAI
ncbi:MAG TPA: DNA-binding protein [Gammaproteobacteria bacterium]|nr:DNA-binding protein [Gammaproteobacteria bacterium]|tara:strand:- start:5071 stop:5394 length:324 start_codon:yes stop_codon:yes gene_type:complete